MHCYPLHDGLGATPKPPNLRLGSAFIQNRPSSERLGRARVLAAMLCFLAVGAVAWASPSGLNNIPTTDVVPPKTVVLQTWLDFPGSTQVQQTGGFKAGGFEGLEFGVDWKAYGNQHGDAAGQVKYAFDILPKFWNWKGVVGIANLTCNTEHNGEVFPYVATSVDLDVFRLHLGYAGQPHNEAFFAGIDKTVPFLDRNLQLKGDAIHFNDKKDVLFSVGFLYELGLREDAKVPETDLAKLLNDIAKNFILEAWASMPSNGDNESYTLKLNYVIRF
jgi:hypothetical protein